MTKFRFEIQNCIETVIEAKSVEDARMKIINNIDEFADMMVEDCYVSDGIEEKGKK